jgi:hypothetical protein
MLALGAAHPQDVTSLGNWHKMNPGISRQEIRFLTRHEDLISLSPPGDGLLTWVERFLSERLLSFTKVRDCLVGDEQTDKSCEG